MNCSYRSLLDTIKSVTRNEGEKGDFARTTILVLAFALHDLYNAFSSQASTCPSGNLLAPPHHVASGGPRLLTRAGGPLCLPLPDALALPADR
jgi:hypothetical protein